MIDPPATVACFATLPAVYGAHAGNYWDRMVRDFSAALSARGLPCTPVDLSQRENASQFLSLPSRARPAVLLTYNLNAGLEIEFQGRTIPLPAAVPYPTVHLLMDHPVHCFDALWAMEREAAIGGVGAPSRLYVPMDRFHLRSVALGGRAALPLSQGGPTPIPNPRPLRERPISVMNFGTLGVPSTEVALPNALGLEGKAAEVGRAMIADVLGGTDDVETIVRSHLARVRPKLEIVPLVHAIRAVDFHARAVRRWRLARSLASLPVVHFGNASPEAQASLPGWQFRGALPFDELWDRMAESRVVLSDTINLRGAALMRTFYAMAQGCAVATDMNAFLTTEFADGKSIVALSLDADGRGNADKIQGLLADSDRLQAIADEGRTIHGARHTWHARAEILAPKIRELIDGRQRGRR